MVNPRPPKLIATRPNSKDPSGHYRVTKHVSKLPKIRPRQRDILTLLYYFRYLDRTQIQSMLDHKDKRAVVAWLRDLRDKQFVDWIYDTSKDGRTKPAVYFLTAGGVRSLRTSSDTTLSAVHRLYGSASRTPAFIARHLFIAGIAIQLRSQNSDNTNFKYATSAAYLSEANGPTVMSQALIRPDLLVHHHEGSTRTYLLEYIPTTLPTYRLRTKLIEYLDFLGSHDWEPTNPMPEVLLIAQTAAQAAVIRREVRRLQSRKHPPAEVTIRLTRSDQIAASNMLAPIWQELTVGNACP